MRKLAPAALGIACSAWAFASASAATITPGTFEATIGVGGTVSIDKTITVDATLTNLDVFFLADNTGSMFGVIENVKSFAGSLLTGLGTTYTGAQFGVGRYVGDPIEGEPKNTAYQLQQAITGNQAAVQAAINAWTASGGGDTPEANFFALHQMATEGGTLPRVVDGSTDGTGQVTGWRPGAQKVAIWFGDEPSHTASVTEAEAIAALAGAGVKVIALNSGPDDSGIDGSFGGDSNQAEDVAAGTGGLLVNEITALTAGALQTLIETSIGSIASDIDLLFGHTAGAGLGISIVCTDVLGCNDVGGGESRTFRVDITGLAPGVYDFTVFAAGVDAVETDRITVTADVPAPATLALLGAALFGLGASRRRAA